jgi:hypothetical protein
MSGRPGQADYAHVPGAASSRGCCPAKDQELLSIPQAFRDLEGMNGEILSEPESELTM